MRIKNFQESSRGGLEVELWTDNSLPSALVDRIPLGAMYLYGTIWTRYIYKGYRRVFFQRNNETYAKCKHTYYFTKIESEKFI